jgi:hypothetical protein
MSIFLRPLLAIFMLCCVVYDAVSYLIFRKLKVLRPFWRARMASKQKALLDPEQSLSFLEALLGVASKTGAQVFVISGTLLGLYRNGRILGHDHDIDLGVIAGDNKFAELLQSLLSLPGARLSAVELNSTEQILNPWLPKDAATPIHKFAFDNPARPSFQFHVDLFVHWAQGDFLVHGNQRTLWLNRKFDLAPLKVGSHSFLAPRDIETYLTENYGDFRTENRDFANGTDCPNIANIYGFRAAMQLSGLYMRFRAAGKTEKRKVAGRRIKDLLAYGCFLRGEPQWQVGLYAGIPEGRDLTLSPEIG